MPNKVVVVGSYNTDMTIQAARIPRPGETILGGKFTIGAGGKGANQAVAAARAGAQVWLVARIGDDAFGHEARRCIEQEGISIDWLIRDHETPTGVACIVVDAAGENSIVVASGANARLQPEDIAAAEEIIAHANVLLLQLESPLSTVMAASRLAAKHGVTVVLNPAPAQPLAADLLEHVTIISPNAVEAEMLTGIKIGNEQSLVAAAQRLHAQGPETVMITLGPKGVFLSSADGARLLPAFPVAAIDTTGAGDIFNGCLAAFLAKDRSLDEAARMAAAAAAISVTRLGAQASAPSLAEIERFLDQ
jgi:ribokinase